MLPSTMLPCSSCAQLELTTPPSHGSTPTQQPQQQNIVRIVTTTYGGFGVWGLEAFEKKKGSWVNGVVMDI
jgi:formate-dependent phosphoribosylglycinamide formyltransferase (GAR transformylase)